MIGAWTDDDEPLWVFEKSYNGGYHLTLADDPAAFPVDATTAMVIELEPAIL